MKRLVQLLKNLPVYWRIFGLRGILDFARIRFRPYSTKPLPMHLRGNSRPLWLRPGSTDIGTLRDIFIGREYDLRIGGDVRTMVDAGANVGLSTVFFAQRFPNARIVAVEPEAANFRLLEMNTRAYPNVTAVHAALWNSAGEISLIDPGRGDHGFTTSALDAPQAAREKIPAIEFNELMRRFEFTTVDLFKCDIEGAEKEVFESSEAWIGRVQTVIAELHDRFKPGCYAAFMHATRDMPVCVHWYKLVMRSRRPISADITGMPT
jgi:FkbM family methyltransferase